MIKRISLPVILLLFLTGTALAQDHPTSEHPKSEHPKSEHPKSEHPVAKKAPSVADQIAGLQAMCSESAAARAERQQQKPLYERLGGYDKIHALTTEIVRLHGINETIKHTLKGVDRELLAKHVADFIAAGTGGSEKYTGRDMPSSHAHLKLTDAEFLAAGSDVMKAMQGMEYGQNEINEIICILVSLKDQVVFK